MGANARAPRDSPTRRKVRRARETANRDAHRFHRRRRAAFSGASNGWVTRSRELRRRGSSPRRRSAPPKGLPDLASATCVHRARRRLRMLDAGRWTHVARAARERPTRSTRVDETTCDDGFVASGTPRAEGHPFDERHAAIFATPNANARTENGVPRPDYPDVAAVNTRNASCGSSASVRSRRPQWRRWRTTTLSPTMWSTPSSKFEAPLAACWAVELWTTRLSSSRSTACPRGRRHPPRSFY